jgi:cell division protein FtsZ
LEEASIQGARGVLMNITGSSQLGMHEVDEAAKIIQRAADEEANIIFGTVLDEAMGTTSRLR